MPVGPPPTTAKRSQAARSAGSEASSASSKRAQDLRADRAGVVERLEVAGGARRDDQAVVAELERRAVGHRRVRDALVEVEAADLGEQHAGVVLPAQHAAQRRGDLSLGQDAGGDLVEEWLEQVVVGAVDEGDLDGRPFQCLRRVEAAEASADDEDAMCGHDAVCTVTP